MDHHSKGCNQIKKNYSKEDAIGYIRLLKHSKRIFDTAYLKLADYPFENIQSMFPYVPELMRLSFTNQYIVL